MERYRAELRNRRRKRGESAQAVYQDVCRLLVLGFPGHSGELCEIIGRDAFLEALADQALRIRVLDQQPATWDEALAIVCRMEAYSVTLGSTDEIGEDGVRRRVRAVRASADDDDFRGAPITRLVQQLEQSVKAGNFEPTSAAGKTRLPHRDWPSRSPPTPTVVRQLSSRRRHQQQGHIISRCTVIRVTQHTNMCQCRPRHRLRSVTTSQASHIYERQLVEDRRRSTLQHRPSDADEGAVWTVTRAPDAEEKVTGSGRASLATHNRPTRKFLSREYRHFLLIQKLT
jgi:hypothetical protein